MAGLSLILGVACSDDGNAGGSGTDGDSSGAQTASDTAGTAPSTSGASATSTSGATSTTGVSTGSETAAESGNFLDPDSGSTGPAEPGPNGAPCMGNDECVSEFCYTVPMLGGFCSECLVDSDCPDGTCSIDFNLGYAVCTDGGIGTQCDPADPGCQDPLVCVTLADVGFFQISTCSECETTADCTDPAICSPVYDIDNISGHFACTDPMSVPNNEGCPVDAGGVGDPAVCMSGHCGVATVFNVLDVGICGECTMDTDCPMAGQTCIPANADSGLQGAVCQ